jgi:hypothetical protein
MVELDINRLDQAAQARDVPYYTDRSRVVMTVLALFTVVIAIVAGSSAIENTLVRVTAFFLCLSVLGLWFRSKYAAFTSAILFSGLTIGIIAFRDRPHDLAGIIINLLLCAALVAQAYVEWIRSIRFVRVQALSWSGERTQVEEWLDQMENPNEPTMILQFSSGSFWTGYFTYRLFNTGPCWLVVKYKTGALNRALEHRVFPSDGVRITQLPEGATGLELNGRAISNIQNFAEDAQRLYSFGRSKELENLGA